VVPATIVESGAIATPLSIAPNAVVCHKSRPSKLMASSMP
jgi:hypothetical protein